MLCILSCQICDGEFDCIAKFVTRWCFLNQSTVIYYQYYFLYYSPRKCPITLKKQQIQNINNYSFKKNSETILPDVVVVVFLLQVVKNLKQVFFCECLFEGILQQS
eukprot:TRINITY_DN116_c0_g1_i1.p9 TRINITY_DN116_c0_g1~~TRINITY_DN116_c0_g1_i1.p9  ORF type:complete len:106 (-),score=1.43 TRINITY_DN116_c0_g1_i1:914-1231(-)